MQDYLLKMPLEIYHFCVVVTLAHLRKRYFNVTQGIFLKTVLQSHMICQNITATHGKVEIPPLPKDKIVEKPVFEKIYFKTS